MKWTNERPTQSGFYYWQNNELRSLSIDAVCVVQVSKYANREGFSAQTLHAGCATQPSFNCDLGQEPAGRWAGPLPQPY